MEARPKELLHLAHIHHPDVVDEAGDDGLGGPGRPGGRGQRGNCSLLAVTPDRAGGDLPPRASQNAGDEVLAPEAETAHELGERADDIVGASDGGLWLDAGTHAVGLRIGGSFPVEDGVGADEDAASRLLSAPGEEVPHLEDAGARGRRVVRTVPLRDLRETGGEDFDGLPGEARSQLRLLDAGLGLGERVPEAAEEAQVGAGGEPQQVRGGERGAQGEPLGLRVGIAAQAQVDGWRRLGQEQLLYGKVRPLALGHASAVPDQQRSVE